MIQNAPIEIQNFAKYKFSGGTTTRFLYQFNPNNSSKYDGIPYFFISISVIYSNLYIYEECKGQNFTKIVIYKDNQFYGYKIQNVTSQKFTFEVYSTRGGGNIIFIDNTKEINTNLIDFLNFNFMTTTSYTGLSFPLIFNINSVEKSTVQFDYNFYDNNFYNSDYQLEYCKLNENQCEYKGINMTVIFEKEERYKIKYNCYIINSNEFEFEHFSSNNTYEIEFNNINFYQLNSNHKEQYFLLNVKNYDHFSIYFENGSGSTELYTKFINGSDSENVEKIGNNEYSFDRKSLSFNEKICNFDNKNNDYLVIRVKYNNYSGKEGILGGFPTIYVFKPDITSEFEKGEKVLIEYSHDYYRYIIVSSHQNMIKLDYSFNSDFIDKIITPSNSEEKKYIYVDSSKEKTKIQFFKADFPYYAKTKLNLIYDDHLKEKLDSYGPDSLFMRMSSYSSDFISNVFYIYDLKEEYYLYTKKLYGNINFYQYNKELNAFSNISKFETPFYQNLDEFNLIKEELLNISGYQILTFYNSYNSLIDFYFQKIKDSAYISINSMMLI